MSGNELERSSGHASGGTGERAVNIIVVEDEPLFRDLLVRSCMQAPGVQVRAAYATGEAAVEEFPSLSAAGSVDVAVVDVQLRGGMNGLRVAHVLREVEPSLGVLILSNHRLPSLISALDTFELRGFSYLRKTSVSDFATLHRTIQGCARGHVVVDKGLLETGIQPQGRLALLTDRHREILDLVAQGYSNAAIADILHVSSRTVENHLLRIYQTLGLGDSGTTQPRVQAVVVYLAERFPIELGHLIEHGSSRGAH